MPISDRQVPGAHPTVPGTSPQVVPERETWMFQGLPQRGSGRELLIDDRHAAASQGAPPARGKAAPDPSSIRLRSFLLGLLLIPPDVYWIISMEKVHTGPYPTVISIFINTIFILTVLAGANALVRRLRPSLALSTAEMLIVYAMVTIASALAGHDMIPTIVATMGYPWHAANPYNNWSNTFLPHLPEWLSVTDTTVLKPLYMGNSSLYASGHWRPWVLPSAWWASFFVVMVFIMMCINTLVRKPWIEHERLTFPVVQLPIAMTEPKGEIWRSRLFWIAFALTFTLELVNGLSLYFPSLPTINVTERDHNLAEGLTSMPWSAIGWLPYSFYPFVIGLGYLLPADLSFSVWFFYLFWKVQKVVAASLGMDVSFYCPYIREQEFGGAVALVLVLVWGSRSHLRRMWLKVTGRDSTLDDSGEPIPYRMAAAGALLGLLYVTWFMVRIGMSPLIALLAFGIYFIMAIAVTRIRAELGPPVHDMPFTPDFVMTSGMGVGRFANGDLVGLGYFWGFHSAYRSHPMPIGLEAMKMAQATKSSQSKFFWAVIVAACVGAAATFWAYLHLGYSHGLETRWNYGAAWAWEVTKRINMWWGRSPEIVDPNWVSNTAMGAGFAFCLLLSYARMHILSWPFHPIGFIISGMYQVNLVWVPLLIAWLIKVCILRYGGLRIYKLAIPFFLGLIVGEMVMGCLWGIIGIVFDIPYYNFFGA